MEQVGISVFHLGKSYCSGVLQLTIVDFAQVRQFVGFTKIMHEVSQTRGVQMRRMSGEQCPDKLPEP